MVIPPFIGRQSLCRRQGETTALFSQDICMKVSNIKKVNICDPATRRHVDSRSHGGKCVTGHTAVTHQAQCVQNATGDASSIQRAQLRNRMKIGTWNVRGMIQPGKKEIIDKEQQRYDLKILGLTETHMKCSGFYTTPTGHTVYFSGPENESKNGVAVSVAPDINKSVLGYNPVSDRIITLKINTRPCRVNLVVVYAPTAASTEADIETFYNQVEDTLKKLPSRDVTLLLGDLNAKIGDTTNDNHLREVVGKFGLGERNERGEMWLQFCTENSLTIMNTCFKNHPRRLYTWVMPGDRARNQIDYITIAKRWRSCISNTKTYPGADCGSDHKLLVAEMTLKLKKCPRIRQKPQRRPDKCELSVFSHCVARGMMDFTVDCSMDINHNWNKLKEIILSSRKESQRVQLDAPKKTWITEETWKAIKARKELLIGKVDSRHGKYQEISATVQRLCRKDYNDHLNSICQDIEDHARNVHTRDLFLKIRCITRELKPRTWAIENDEGTLLTEVDQVTERWRSYCEGLYAHSATQPMDPLDHVEDHYKEPKILESEIRSALRKLKNNKAAGGDNIFAEELKLVGEQGVKVILDLCNLVWRKGIWPTDWKQSLVIPLHKKGSTKTCGNYRTVALISHASKIMLYVLNSRLQSFLQWQIPSEQAGFVKGRGTREQIVNMRQIIEKSREFNTPMIMCFIDYSKAFDCVRWDCLWDILREMGVPQHLIVLIANLYQEGESMVRVNDIISGPFKPGKGVRQGCILSPILFNIYGEYIMRRALDGWEGGISIGGVKISNLRYADDTTIFASSEKELAQLFRRLELESGLAGLSINKSKTKVMIIDRTGQLARTGELSDLEFVSEFVYLGSLLSDKGGSEHDIRRRIQIAKGAMSKLTRIWQNRKISTKTKKRLVQTLVFSIFLYGSEAWTIRASERKKIEAFEMWCWRRMLRIPWTARRTNKSILEQLQIRTRLSTICFQKILGYFGHIARRLPNNLDKLIVVGKVEGKRLRGRSPSRWSDQVKALTGLPLTTAMRKAEDRTGWKGIVDNATKALQYRHDLQT